jgi:hypothetical protein
MIKKGDRFIHFTKNGGVNKGEVEWYGETINYDYQNKVSYISSYIKTTNNVVLFLDGNDGQIYKIKDDIVGEPFIGKNEKITELDEHIIKKLNKQINERE